MRRAIRKALLSAACAGVLSPIPAVHAQDEPLPTVYFGPQLGYVVPDSARDADFGTTLQLLLGIGVADSLSLELSALAQQTRRESDSGVDYSYGGGVDLTLGTPAPGNPLFFLGGGYLYEDIQQTHDQSGYGNLGLGLYLPLTFSGELWRLEGRYTAIFNDTVTPNSQEFTEDVRISLGVLFGLAYEERVPDSEPPPPEPEPAPAPMLQPASIDEDGDGIPDIADRCPSTPAWVRADPSGCTPDTDGDGVDETRDCCPGTAEGTAVDAQGCEPVPAPMPPPPAPPVMAPVAPAPADEDADGVDDAVDKCPHTATGLQVDAAGCVIVSSVVLTNVHFEFNSDRLTHEAYRILNSVAASMQQQPGVVVEIAGHADQLGSPGYNLQLSQRRADVVRDFLFYLGVPPERVTAKAYGESRPIADNKTEEGRARNRRVEFKMLNP